jgi:hypothetical protein
MKISFAAIVDALSGILKTNKFNLEALLLLIQL